MLLLELIDCGFAIEKISTPFLWRAAYKYPSCTSTCSYRKPGVPILSTNIILKLNIIISHETFYGNYVNNHIKTIST